MNKSELIEKIAHKADIKRTEAQAALEAITGSIISALKEGDNVRLVGFGAFESRARAARSGRNPQTGEAIQIAAANTPAFKAGKGLKDALN